MVTKKVKIKPMSEKERIEISNRIEKELMKNPKWKKIIKPQRVPFAKDKQEKKQ